MRAASTGSADVSARERRRDSAIVLHGRVLFISPSGYLIKRPALISTCPFGSWNKSGASAAVLAIPAMLRSAQVMRPAIRGPRDTLDHLRQRRSRVIEAKWMLGMKIDGRRLQTDDASLPPLGSGRLSLLAAFAAAGATILLMRVGSGHTVSSRSFAARPEFTVWTWILAGEAAAAAAAAIAMWPAVRILCQATGARSIFGAVVTWLAVGLALLFGPKPITGPGHLHLWLLADRLLVISIAVGCLLSPCVVGMMLVQPRLAALRAETPTIVATKRAGHVVVELLWLRAALQWFLISFAVVITGAVLSAGAGRRALLADGATAQNYPLVEILIYGGVATMASALIFVPTYIAWQQRAVDTRDRLYPVPEDGQPKQEWHQSRNDFDALLSARRSAASVLAAAFVILTPLVGSLVTALIPGP